MGNSKSYNPIEENIEKWKLERAQISKRNDLRGYVSSANSIIEEMNKLIDDITKAKECKNQVKDIPSEYDSIFALMNTVKASVNEGLQVGGANLGDTIASGADTIKGEISSSVSSIISKCEEYIERKSSEFSEKGNNVSGLKRQYSGRLQSYPADLGIYGPAPTFPEVPQLPN